MASTDSAGGFAPDPAFMANSIHIADLQLCHVRLETDARYPWLILVPRVPRAIELEDLSRDQGAQAIAEVVLAGQAVRAIGAALGRPVTKLNVAQLGNVTRQLHIHVIGRRPEDDDAGMRPVWSVGEAVPYAKDRLHIAMQAARDALALQERTSPA